MAAWCGRAEEFLDELGQLSFACGLIERRYFGGHSVLYPDAAETIQDLLEAVGGLIAVMNEHFVPGWERFAGFRKPADARPAMVVAMLAVPGEPLAPLVCMFAAQLARSTAVAAVAKASRSLGPLRAVSTAPPLFVVEVLVPW